MCSVAFFCATYLLQSVLLARQYAYVVWVLPTYITDRRYYELNRVHFFADSDFHALPYVRASEYRLPDRYGPVHEYTRAQTDAIRKALNGSDSECTSLRFCRRSECLSREHHRAR